LITGREIVQINGDWIETLPCSWSTAWALDLASGGATGCWSSACRGLHRGTPLDVRRTGIYKESRVVDAGASAPAGAGDLGQSPLARAWARGRAAAPVRRAAVQGAGNSGSMSWSYLPLGRKHEL